MSASHSAATAGGVATPATPGRPAPSGRGERPTDSLLCLETGAGPEQSTKEDCVARSCPQARPVRFDDPARNAAYWARIDALVDAAPPLSTEQKAVIRAAFHAPAAQEAA